MAYYESLTLSSSEKCNSVVNIWPRQVTRFRVKGQSRTVLKVDNIIPLAQFNSSYAWMLHSFYLSLPSLGGKKAEKCSFRGATLT